jgi:hypothetical protein
MEGAGTLLERVEMIRFNSVALWLWSLLSLACMLFLTGCEPSPPKPMVVGITGYNFTGEGVQEYYVDGHWGSNLPPYGGGGKTSCCVALPRQWSPEQTVEVVWTMGHWTTPYESRKHLSIEEQIRCCSAEHSLSRSVLVQPYGKEGGGVQVFFLPDDEVRVYVTDYDLGHEKHPSGMAYPKKPTGFE